MFPLRFYFRMREGGDEIKTQVCGEGKEGLSVWECVGCRYFRKIFETCDWKKRRDESRRGRQSVCATGRRRGVDGDRDCWTVVGEFLRGFQRVFDGFLRGFRRVGSARLGETHFPGDP